MNFMGTGQSSGLPICVFLARKWELPQMCVLLVELDCVGHMMEKRNRQFSCWLTRSMNDPRGGTGSEESQKWRHL